MFSKSLFSLFLCVSSLPSFWDTPQWVGSSVRLGQITIPTCQGCVSTASLFPFVAVLTGPQRRDMKGSWNSAGYVLDFPFPLDGWVAPCILVRDVFAMIKNCEVGHKGCKDVQWSYFLKAEHSSDSSQIMSACQPGFGRHVTSHAWLTVDTAREAATGHGNRCNRSIWGGCCGKGGLHNLVLNCKCDIFNRGQISHTNYNVGNASDAQCGFGVLVSV